MFPLIADLLTDMFIVEPINRHVYCRTSAINQQKIG